MEFSDWSFLALELSYRFKLCPFLFSLRFLLEYVGVLSKEERLCGEVDDMAEVSDTSGIGIFLVRIEMSDYSSNYSAIFRSVIPHKESQPVNTNYLFYNRNYGFSNILFSVSSSYAFYIY